VARQASPLGLITFESRSLTVMGGHDAAGIDEAYDVAISTASGFLDHIVVETAQGGAACVEYLRKHNLGRCVASSCAGHRGDGRGVVKGALGPDGRGGRVVGWVDSSLSVIFITIVSISNTIVIIMSEAGRASWCVAGRHSSSWRCSTCSSRWRPAW
jgi:hypothetical protein